MDPGDCLETVFRDEYGRIMAGLIRLSGSFDRAEEALQESFAAAWRSWCEKGIPENPGGWITMTARRKLIDAARRERTRRDKQEALQYETDRVQSAAEERWVEESMQFPDDRLRLIFTCCHPALNREAQVALTLRTLSGLTTTEIAKAFLVAEPTMAQRLVRAKRKIQEARIPYAVPAARQLPERLAAVRVVIYLIFNEGYTAASGDQLVRSDLCQEAIRLGRVLRELLPGDPESAGLLALMLLHDARRAARVQGGELVTLEEQDRSLWDPAAIAEGLALIDSLEEKNDSDGPYGLQAAIAACHVRVHTAGATDWKRIRLLYARLLRLQDSPVVALNHAAAVAMSEGLEQGLAEVKRLEHSGNLEHYYLLHAARADILRRMHRVAEAIQSYQAALALATNQVEQRYLQRRINQLRVSQKSAIIDLT